MKRNFTDDDIIRFLYDEMCQSEIEAFLDALCSDELLWERYEYFQKVVERVSEIRFDPSKKSCEKILAFAHNCQIESPSVVFEPSIPKAEPVSVLSGILPISINLNAVIVIALIFFVSIAVTGTFLKLNRGAIENPDTISLVQQLNLKEEQLIKWEDAELDAELKTIRQGLENLEGEPTL